MTDIQEMVQRTDMSNANYIGDSDATGDCLYVVKEFKLYYEKFVGYPVEDNLFCQNAGELFSSTYGKQPVWSHPLARTALVGAGSLAATLVVGFALSHDAGEQPADQLVPPSAPPAQPSYREQASRTSLAPRVASPAFARVEFSNSQAAQPPAISQPDVAISPRVEMPLQLPPVVQPIRQIEAIAPPETGQPILQSNAAPPEQATAPAQPAQNDEIFTLQAVSRAAASPASPQPIDRSASIESTGNGAIAPPQPLSGENTTLRAVDTGTPSEASPPSDTGILSDTGTPSEASPPSDTGTPSEASEILPSQLRPALPSWVNSNLAPLETNPSDPSENMQPPSGVEAPSNQQTETSVEPDLPNAGQNLDSAQIQTGGIWEVSSSIAIRSIVSRNHGISQPEASISRQVAIEDSQATSAYPTARKSASAKLGRPMLAK